MPPVIPLATYRVQFTKDFGFDDAAALVPYLQATSASAISTPRRFSKRGPAARTATTSSITSGSIPSSAAMRASTGCAHALKQNDIGLILDFVPNHMGVGRADNAWWLDVLEWGQRSRRTLPRSTSTGRRCRSAALPGVLLPILGRPYGEALQSGEIELKYDAETGSFAAWYFEHKLPINPQRYSEMLRTMVDRGAGGKRADRARAAALAHEYRNPARRRIAMRRR